MSVDLLTVFDVIIEVVHFIKKNTPKPKLFAKLCNDIMLDTLAFECECIFERVSAKR